MRSLSWKEYQMAQCILKLFFNTASVEYMTSSLLHLYNTDFVNAR